MRQCHRTQRHACIRSAQTRRLKAAERARRGVAGVAPARAPGPMRGARRAGMLAGRAPVKTVSAHEPTLLALRRVLAAGVGGAAVVEGGAGGAVIANLSTSDLRCAGPGLRAGRRQRVAPEDCSPARLAVRGKLLLVRPPIYHWSRVPLGFPGK